MRSITLAAGFALAAGLVPAGAASAAAPGTGSEGAAYGLALTGPISLPPMPAVSSRGNRVSKSLAREGRTDLVKAKAAEVGAASRSADSTLTDLRVPTAALTAGAVTARCTAGKGSSRLAGAVVAGRRLDSSPAPNTTVPLRIPELGTVAMTLNKQRRTSDGRLAVTGMEIALPKGQKIKVASAICGKPSGKPRKPSTNGPGEAPGKAPVPTPVKGDLAVTG